MSSTATSIVSVSVISDNKNLIKSSSTAPDPEIADDFFDRIDYRQKKIIDEYKSKHGDANNSKKNKDKFNRMMNAIKSKTSKLRSYNNKKENWRNNPLENDPSPLTSVDDETDYDE